ncbi:MAG: hypothetical protein NC923_06995 [Candidatus Omnitrophica bacterium]|nr:hypothetical protein [Candidatus Omnitrophota bacterium]
MGISALTLGYTYFFDSYLWPTKGMKLFLIMSIASLTGLIITSTKWFSNWYMNRISRTKNPTGHSDKSMQPHAPITPRGTNNKGFIIPELAVILTGLGLVALSIPVIIAGSTGIGITMVVLGSSAVIIPCSVGLFLEAPKTNPSLINKDDSPEKTESPVTEPKLLEQKPIEVKPKTEDPENIILDDIIHTDESSDKSSEVKSIEELPLIFGDPLAKALFSLNSDKDIVLSQQAITAINTLFADYSGLTLEIDVDTLIDTSKGMPQLKGYGFKEAIIALYKAQQNKGIPEGLRIRLINLNSQLDKAKIIQILGLNEELTGGLILIPEIPEDYLIKGLEPYLIDGSIRVVFEDNLKYWKSKVDVVVKKGDETEVLSSLGLIVAALAKEPIFYQELPAELKDYIVAVTDEKGDVALDDQEKIKQLIFKPIEKEKLNTEYIEELNRTNKALEGMV